MTTKHEAEAAERERCAHVVEDKYAGHLSNYEPFLMHIRSLADAIRSLPPTAEDGVVVPREPTQAMIEAAGTAPLDDGPQPETWEETCIYIYKAMLFAAQAGNEQRGPKGSATSADLSDAEAVTAKADPHQQAPSGAQEAAKLECSVYINGKRAPDQDAARKLFADACRRTKHAAPSTTQQDEQDLDRACANATKRMETIRAEKSGLPAEAGELRSFTICKDHVNAEWNQPELGDLNCVLCRLFYLEAQETLLEEWQQRAKRAEDAIAEIERPLDAQMERLNNTVIRLTADNERQAAEIAQLSKLVYVPGLWRCAKCKCQVVSQTLHVNVGAVSANNEPQECPNKCGPMWRLTERDAGNDLADRLEKQHAEIERLRGLLHETIYGHPFEQINSRLHERIRAALEGGK